LTLLDAVTAETPHGIEHSLADALASVQGAYALVTTNSPGGIYGICVLDETFVDFYDAEVAAMDVLISLRRQHPDAAVDLLCVSRRDAARMDFPDPSAQVYRLS
jgi:hypothetical protein